MNKRLKYIYDLISKNSIGVLDVGTDHGFIPVSLAENGFGGNIIASDINSIPLSRAVSAAEKKGVGDRIQFQVFDGLNPAYEKLVDTIVIAGMGGDLICSIIDHGDWILDLSYSLILQPMSKPEILRYYLVNNGFAICSEKRVYDRGRIYNIIECSFTDQNTSYSTLELYVGRFSFNQELQLYLEQLNALLSECRKILTGRIGERSHEMEFYQELEQQIVEEQSKYREINNVSKE